MSNDEVFGVIVLTAVFTSMFWGIIWSIATIDRLKSALYRKEMND
jgi:hypothetical protein